VIVVVVDAFTSVGNQFAAFVERNAARGALVLSLASVRPNVASIISLGDKKRSLEEDNYGMILGIYFMCIFFATEMTGKWLLSCVNSIKGLT
jgi:hypothetical protein